MKYSTLSFCTIGILLVMTRISYATNGVCVFVPSAEHPKDVWEYIDSGISSCKQKDGTFYDVMVINSPILFENRDATPLIVAEFCDFTKQIVYTSFIRKDEMSYGFPLVTTQSVVCSLVDKK